MSDSNALLRRGPGGHELLTLRLYVAGDGPNSCEARANLAAMLKGRSAEQYDLEEIDFLREPLRAMRDGVIVTPTLVKLAPRPVQRIIGTLRERLRVQALLGLDEPGNG